MENSKEKIFKRYFISIFMLVLVNLFLAYLICILTNKKSYIQFSTILFWTSGVIMGIGGLSFAGSVNGRNNIAMQKGRSVGVQTQEERIKEDMSLTEKNFKLVIVTGITGVIGFLISFVVLKI